MNKINKAVIVSACSALFLIAAFVCIYSGSEKKQGDNESSVSGVSTVSDEYSENLQDTETSSQTAVSDGYVSETNSQSDDVNRNAKNTVSQEAPGDEHNSESVALTDDESEKKQGKYDGGDSLPIIQIEADANDEGTQESFSEDYGDNHEIRRENDSDETSEEDDDKPDSDTIELPFVPVR